MAYYRITKQFQAPADEDDETVEEQIEVFEEKIGQRKSSDTRAQEMLRATMIARGVDPDTVPELSPELRAKMEQDALQSNQDLFFSGALDSGKEIRGKKVKTDVEIEW